MIATVVLSWILGTLCGIIFSRASSIGRTPEEQEALDREQWEAFNGKQS